MAENDNVAHALAGAGGGALSMVVTYPLITLSTRAQTESMRTKKDSKAETVSALAAARKIVKREGISGLYSGLDSALFGISVTNFVYYYFYESSRTIFQLSKAAAGAASMNLTTGESMLAGAVAGSATVVLTNPIWVVNTRMTVSEKKQGTIATIKEIATKDGLKTFFSGIAPALVLVINPILQYTIFEQLKNRVEKRRKFTAGDAFLYGALGKLVATTVTYPYITLKSRMQIKQKDGKQINFLSGIKQIINDEGIAGLYKGLDTKVVQSVLTSAFLFFFKEQLFSVAIVFLALLRSYRK